MATFDDLSLHIRLFMKGYPFSRYAIAPTPLARLGKPLARSRVALVTTAGLRTPDQSDFDRSTRLRLFLLRLSGRTGPRSQRKRNDQRAGGYTPEELLHKYDFRGDWE